MSDFGQKPRRPRRPKMVFIVLGGAVAIALAIVGTVLKLDRDARIAEAERWNIQGAPCPELTRAAFEAGRMVAPKKFTYDAFTLGRASGHVDCNQVGAGGGHHCSVEPRAQSQACAGGTGGRPAARPTQSDQRPRAPALARATSAIARHASAAKPWPRFDMGPQVVTRRDRA